MKAFETVQKFFNAFHIVTIIASIICIVNAVLSGVGALCAVTQYNGGTALHIGGEPFNLFADGTNLIQKSVYLISVTFMLIAEAILLKLTHSYLKSEQADGTPFTYNGAERLKKLGIRFIWIPIVAIAVSETVAAWQGVDMTVIAADFGSVVTGVILILVSVIFRYGAELEKNTGA